MEDDLLKYENRDQLYNFLIEDFGFSKLDEKYYSESFGDFYVILRSNKFLLRYSNDKSFLTVQIAALKAPTDWLDLLFVKNFIYNPEDINPDAQDLNPGTRIEELNDFLRSDFDLICDLFSAENHSKTSLKIHELLKSRFHQRFPGFSQEI